MSICHIWVNNPPHLPAHTCILICLHQLGYVARVDSPAWSADAACESVGDPHHDLSTLCTVRQQSEVKMKYLVMIVSRDQFMNHVMRKPAIRL